MSVSQRQVPGMGKTHISKYPSSSTYLRCCEWMELVGVPGLYMSQVSYFTIKVEKSYNTCPGSTVSQAYEGSGCLQFAGLLL